MGGNGVSDISAGAGEGVGGVVNGAGLTLGSIARPRASGVAVLWGQRLVSTMSWFQLYEWAPVHHHGIEPRPASCHPTRSLSRNTGLLVLYTNYLTPPQTTSAVSLKLHTNLSSNYDTTPVSISVNPPHSTLASAALKNFTSASCILLLRKASVFGPKYLFSFRFHLYMS